MENNVVSIETKRAVEISFDNQQFGVVTVLSDALTRAKRGEIYSVFIAYSDEHGNAGGTWDGKASHILMAVSRLIHRFHRYMDLRERK